MALPIVFEGRTGAQIAGDVNAELGALGAEALTLTEGGLTLAGSALNAGQAAQARAGMGLGPATRSAGGIAVDFSAQAGTLTKPTGGTASAIELDSTVTFRGLPTVKCTFSTTAADVYVGRFALTNPVSFKDFFNLVIPIKITAVDAVGGVATYGNPIGVWLKTAGGKQYRLRLVADGTSPDGWAYFSFNRQETEYLITFSGGAVSMADLDTELISTIDIVHAAPAGVVSAGNPIWFGPILRDTSTYPIATLRFDGQYLSQYTLAFPILQEYGLRASLFLQHSLIGAGGRMTKAQITEMYSAGCEVSMHTFDSSKTNGYANATNWPTAASITDDIVSGWRAQAAEGWTAGRGVLCEAFSGNYFGGATTVARQRLVKAGIDAAGVDVFCNYSSTYRGKNQTGATERARMVRATETLAAGTTAAAVVAQIDQVAQSNEWMVIMCHEFVADSVTPSGNQIRISDFETICAAIASSGVKNLCLADAYSQIYA